MTIKQYVLLTAVVLALLLTACGDTAAPTASVTTTTTATATTATTTTAPTTTTLPPHSPLYSPDFPVDEVILWFNEVCLDAEFVNDGDATLLQKWTQPIYYKINGEPTDEDRQVLTDFVSKLNAIDGFPGMQETVNTWEANMNLYFCSPSGMLDLLGENYRGMDGGVTFWYDGNNEIYNAVIGYRNDIDQSVRNTVIMEEIYNGLGPVQDTTLRPDSIIAAAYSTPQQWTAADELIMKLLYHPQLICGMNADECEAVIREIYY